MYSSPPVLKMVYFTNTINLLINIIQPWIEFQQIM